MTAPASGESVMRLPGQSDDVQRPDMPEVMTVRDAARCLRVHENTVRSLIAKGTLQAVQLPVSGYRRPLASAVYDMAEEMTR